MNAWKRITLVSLVLIGGTASFGYWSFSQIDTIFDDLNSSYGANTASILLSNQETFFTFPQKGDDVYIGCTYKVSWQLPLPVDSLEIALIDAGMEKASESIYSGLAETYTIDTDEQYIEWKVGTVWPGEYYIATSKVNGLDTKIKSETFVVNRTLENIDEGRMTTLCSESGGKL